MPTPEDAKPAPCKYFPNCTNTACPFYHPPIVSVMLDFRWRNRFFRVYVNVTFSFFVRPSFFFLRAFFSLFLGDILDFSDVAKFINCRNYFPMLQPCKFGLRCQALSCPFVHPQKSTVAKLKWVAHWAGRTHGMFSEDRLKFPTLIGLKNIKQKQKQQQTRWIRPPSSLRICLHQRVTNYAEDFSREFLPHWVTTQSTLHTT